MNIIFCILLSYLLIGIGSTVQALKANPLDAPGWAMNANFGTLVYVTLLWPISDMVNMNDGVDTLRSFVFNLMLVLIKITIMTASVWGCFALVDLWFDNNTIIIILGILLLLICTPLITLIVAILMIPTTLILSILINVLFPLNNRE